MKNTTPVRVALIDDHHLVREGLAELISRLGGFRIVLKAANGFEMIEALSNGPDLEVEVALVDLNMPVVDGFAALAWLKAERPLIRAMALTFSSQEEVVLKAVRSGARGFLLKDCQPLELKNALEALVRTGYYHTDLVHNSLLAQDRGRPSGDQQRSMMVAKLTTRELEFIRWACSADELTYDQIADRMKVHPRTVKGYREAVFDKCALKSRVGLVLMATRCGITGQ